MFGILTFIPVDFDLESFGGVTTVDDEDVDEDDEFFFDFIA